MPLYHAQTTSLWRRSLDGGTLCNACSLYQKMKGTPRPVSLKSDVIKHRNRSKGDKKTREAGTSGRGRGKKASTSGTAGRVVAAQRAPSVASTRHSSPALDEVVEEDAEHDDEFDVEGDVHRLSGPAHRRHTVTQAHRTDTHTDSGPPSYGDKALPLSADSSFTSTHNSELAAATALANASAFNRRSVSMDARRTIERYNQLQGQRALLGGNTLYTISNGNGLRPADILGLHGNERTANRASSASEIGSAPASATPSAPPSASQSRTTSPASSHISPANTSYANTLFAAIQQYNKRSAQPDTMGQGIRTHPLMKQQDETSKSLTGLVSRTNAYNSTLSPGFLASRGVYPSEYNHTQANTTQPSNRPLPSNPADTTTSIQQIPPLDPPIPPIAEPPHPIASSSNRSTSTDPYISSWRRTVPADERPRTRLDHLFAAAGQQRQGESGPGRSASVTSSNAYHPYEMPLKRSVSRGPSTHKLEIRHSGAANASNSVREGRPLSSTSSDSPDEQKKNTVVSPDVTAYPSPLLHGAIDAMVVDEEEDTSLRLPHTSPPFGYADRSAQSLERRGRSTTRKTRENDFAHEGEERLPYDLGALRMRDPSRASSRSYSPSLSTIKTAELDDGIVRNAVTHRPVSDLRASDESGSAVTLPSLSMALSSSRSARSLSAPRSGSRHSGSLGSRGSRVTAMRLSDISPPVTSRPASGPEDVSRLQTRIQELEFINSLMEHRVADLEAKIAAGTGAAPHGDNCACRCAERAEYKAQMSARMLQGELAAHGIKGLDEQQSRDLMELLVNKLGYRAGDLQ